MTTIACTHCGKTIELSDALTQDMQNTILAAEHEKHVAELAAARQSADELILAERHKAQQEAASKTELVLKQLRDEAKEEKLRNKQLSQQLLEMTTELRASRRSAENAELEMQKKLSEEEDKIRQTATREADERQRLNLAAKEKTITDLQKSLDEAQRKAAQGSQQLQGEIMELDFETALANAFRDDDVEPVAKGVKGGDIRQVVRGPRGTECGVILWEIKRTKNWTAGWIPKLKQDLRAAKANIPVIITEVMPKHINEDIAQHEGVWIAKPTLAVMLGTLLRKGLLDVGMQKALAQNQGGKAEALYSFVTSHEFIQQIESMVETYQEMTLQVQKERVAYERLWAQRDKQAQKLILGTANIIGSMQGHVGQASMPRIKGLDLLEAGDEADDKDGGVENTPSAPIQPAQPSRLDDSSESIFN